MGAYKKFKEEKDKITKGNESLNVALLEAGIEVYKKADYDLQKIADKPEEFTGLYTESLNNYVKNRLKIKDEAWSEADAEHKSRLLRGYGISQNLIKHVVGQVIPQGQLMNFGAVLEQDEKFERYRTEQREDYRPAEEKLGKAYQTDRVGTVNEALTELDMTGLIEPSAVGLNDISMLEKLARNGVSKDLAKEKIEKIFKSSDLERLLVSKNKE